MDGDQAEPKKKIMLYSMYKSPGPAYGLRTALGTKEHCLTKTQAPAYTIGRKYPEKQEAGPGPYSYDTKITTRGKIRAPAHTITGRHGGKGDDLTPGPADYATHNIPVGVVSVDHKSPSVVIGQRTKLIGGTEVPAPNNYDVGVGMGTRSQARKSVPSWSIRGRSDLGGFNYYNLKAGNPGPASYATVKPSVYKRHAASAGFTIPGRHNQKEAPVNTTPGPGCYDVGDIGTTSSNKRGLSMGIRHSEFIVPLITNIDRV